MLKNALVLLVIIIGIAACGDKKKPIGDFKPLEVKPDVANPPADGATPRTFQEGDYQLRVEYALEKVQHEYDLSRGKVKGQGDVTWYADQNYNVLVRYKHEGDLYESKFNLADLSLDANAIRLIIDQSPEDNPGFTITTIGNKKSIVNLVNGKEVSTTDKISFLLAERTNVENAISGFVSAVRVAQEDK